jgi:hypothetical protein
MPVGSAQKAGSSWFPNNIQNATEKQKLKEGDMTVTDGIEVVVVAEVMLLKPTGAERGASANPHGFLHHHLSHQEDFQAFCCLLF